MTYLDRLIPFLTVIAVALIALALWATPASAQHQTVPTHGPLYRLEPTGWEVLFNAGDWSQLCVYNEAVHQPTQSYCWQTPSTSVSGWYPLAFQPKASTVCFEIQGVCHDNDDTDPVLNYNDTCTLIANGASVSSDPLDDWEQADFDLDGYGNPCDGDFNNSGAVNGSDFNIRNFCHSKGIDMTTPSGIDCRNVDMNTTGTLNISDDNLLGAQYGGPPGPKGAGQ